MKMLVCIQPNVLIRILRLRSYRLINKNAVLPKLHFNFLQTTHYSTNPTIQSKKNRDSNIGTLTKVKSEPYPLKIWKVTKILIGIFGISIASLGIVLLVTLGSPEQDSDGNYIRDDLSDLSLIKQYFIRAGRELEYYLTLFKQPPKDKLLPDPLEAPYLQPKYTLVLEFTDVLVHQDWTIETGWRFKKRPLLDHFLETLSGSYEIIIYTGEQGKTVFPLIDVIDPHQIIAYKLVRDATYHSGGSYVKNLKNLNRDLSKVICIDWNAKNVKFNPENLLCIKRWTGNDDDTSFLDLATFLKTIASNDIDDVRIVLAYYSQYEDPIAAFREKQEKLIEQLESQSAAKRNQTGVSVSKWTPSIFRRSF